MHQETDSMSVTVSSNFHSEAALCLHLYILFDHLVWNDSPRLLKTPGFKAASSLTLNFAET
jgi:hypothetical protein